MATKRTVQARKYDKEEVRRWRELDQKWKEFDWIIQIGKVPANNELCDALKEHAELISARITPPEIPCVVICRIAALVGGGKGVRGKGQLTTERFRNRLSSVRKYMDEKGGLARAPKGLVQAVAKEFGIERKAFETLLRKFPWPSDR